MGQTCLMLA